MDFGATQKMGDWRKRGLAGLNGESETETETGRDEQEVTKPKKKTLWH